MKLAESRGMELRHKLSRAEERILEQSDELAITAVVTYFPLLKVANVLKWPQLY